MTKESANPTFYDADSATYDHERWTTRAGAFTNRAQQRILSELCSDWRDDRVIEIGPGTARFSIPLARQGNRLTLVDISAGMLDVARGNIEQAGLSGQIDGYVHGSVYELPFEADDFDHAISLNVFNHLKQAGDALRQLARVIKPGATLLFNYANLHSYFWAAGRRINRRSTAVGQDVYSKWERPRDVRRMIDEAGLDLLQYVGHVHVPRAIERYRLDPVVRLLDVVSRRGPLKSMAPIHYCLCRKR